MPNVRYVRPVSSVVLLPCSAGSTVGRLQHDLVSDVEFNSVELKAVAVNMRQTNNKPVLLTFKMYLLFMKSYLLVTEFEVRTVSYGPSFFPFAYGPSAKRAGHKSTGLGGRTKKGIFQI